MNFQTLSIRIYKNQSRYQPMQTCQPAQHLTLHDSCTRYQPHCWCSHVPGQHTEKHTNVVDCMSLSWWSSPICTTHIQTFYPQCTSYSLKKRLGSIKLSYVIDLKHIFHHPASTLQMFISKTILESRLHELIQVVPIHHVTWSKFPGLFLIDWIENKSEQQQATKWPSWHQGLSYF